MKSLSQILQSFRGKGRANTLDMSALKEGFSSLKPPWCSISLSSASPTDVGGAAAGTYWKAAGITQENNTGYLSSTPANNRMQYDGDSPRHFHIAVSLSFAVTTGTNQLIGVALAKNGTVLPETELTRLVANNQIGSTALHGDVMLEAGDYVELWVANYTSNLNDIQVENLYMFMVGMLV